MKKSKHINDLEVKKMDLRIRQLEQEKKIRNNWNELKEHLTPGSLMKKKLTEKTSTKSLTGDLLSVALGFGAGLLSRKFTKITDEKIQSSIHRGVEKLIEKLNPVFQKK